MKRLTIRNSDGRAGFAGSGSPTENTLRIPMMLDRLAEYEDTGLEPKELNEKLNEAYDLGAQSVLRYKGLTWSEAEELLRYRDAEEQGLLVRLPCRLGIPIYCLWGDDIYTETIEMICVSDKGFYLETENMGFDESDIGKVVFLTREAAEKALEDV